MCQDHSACEKQWQEETMGPLGKQMNEGQIYGKTLWRTASPTRLWCLISTVTKSQRKTKISSPPISVFWSYPFYYPSCLYSLWFPVILRKMKIWSLVASVASVSCPGSLLLSYFILLIHWSLIKRIWSLPRMPFFSWHSYYNTVLAWFFLPILFISLWLWCCFFSKAFMKSLSCYMILALLLIHSLCHIYILILWMHSFYGLLDVPIRFC